MTELHAVTGAFGYSGKCITQRLLDAGHEVLTLTNSAQRANPFGGRVRAYPFQFDDWPQMAETLRGVKVLYNTYWVRFNHAMFQHETAVTNTLALFKAAQAAGVERVVHVSITNPAPAFLNISPTSSTFSPPGQVTLTITDLHPPGQLIPGAWYAIPATASGGGFTRTITVDLLVGGTRTYLPLVLK